MYVLIDISNQMLEDSAFDMEGEIRGEATEQLLSRKAPKSAAPSGPARSRAASRKLRALAQGIVRDPLQRLHVCEQHHPVGRPAAFGPNGRLGGHAGASLRKTGLALAVNEMLKRRSVAEWLRRAPVAGCEMRVADEEQFDLCARLVEPA